MVGTTIGESVVPIFMGWVMLGGAWTLPLFVFLSTVLMLVLYLIVHVYSTSKCHIAVSTSEEDVNPLHNEEQDVEMVTVRLNDET